MQVKHQIVFLCLLFLSLTNKRVQSLERGRDCFCRERIIPRLVGGVELKARELVPWMVSIGEVHYKVQSNDSSKTIEWAPSDFEYPHMCSGVILNEHWIVTAADCLHEMNKRKMYSFGVGYGINLKTIYSKPPLAPNRVVFHSLYNFKGTPDYNLALVRLKNAIDLSNYEYVQAACLNSKIGAEKNATLHTVGFGMSKVARYDMEKNSLTDVHLTSQMRRVRLTDISSVFLAKNYGMWARALEQNASASLGDGGNPLQITKFGYTQVIGILVSTVTRFENNYRVIGDNRMLFLRFAYHIEWIRQHIFNDYCVLS